jgi:hypothetical protein
MRPTRETVCYLTKISGQFGADGPAGGASAALRIYPAMVNGVEYWFIVASGMQGYGRAECVNYAQPPI